MASLIIQGVVGAGAQQHVCVAQFPEQSTFRALFMTACPCLVYNPSRNAKCCFREPVRLRKCISRGHLFVCGNASVEATRSGLHGAANRAIDERRRIPPSLPLTRNFYEIGKFKSRLKRKRNKPAVTMALVGPGSMRTLFMILSGCAAIGKVLEERTKWGAQLSAPILAMGAGIILSGTGVIPTTSPVYDMVFSTVMPIGAALTILETDVLSAFSEAGPTLKAFWFGALGTILGTVLSFKIIGRSLGPDGWKIASSLCSSYVGGSINYAATAQVLGLNSAHLLAAGMAADNIAMAVYFGIIMAIPDNQHKKIAATNPAIENPDITSEQKTLPTVESLSVSLAVAIAACSAGDALASVLPSSFSGCGLALMAVVASVFNALAGLLFGGAGQTHLPIFSGSQELGTALMLMFFSVVGASSGLREAMVGGWPLTIFIIILISVHLTTIFSLGWWSNLPNRTILIASNANIGGPATAAAMANARCWRGLIKPAFLVGTLGYTIGTAIGCLVGVHVLQPMFSV